MSLPPLKVIVQKALSPKQTASIIFIHGLGDSGAGWQPVAQMLSRKLPYVKWILPSARVQSVTANFGMPSPSWFDIRSFEKEITQEEDEEGVLQSKSEIEALIVEEIKSGIPPERIVVGGFSQGGAVTLATGLTTSHKLAGLVVLSSYIPIREKLKTITTEHASSAPIFMAHGVDDPLLKLSLGVDSSNLLVNGFGWKKESTPEKPSGLTFKAYSDMGHSVLQEELDDLASWLQKVLPPID